MEQRQHLLCAECAVSATYTKAYELLKKLPLHFYFPIITNLACLQNNLKCVKAQTSIYKVERIKSRAKFRVIACWI